MQPTQDGRDPRNSILLILCAIESPDILSVYPQNLSKETFSCQSKFYEDSPLNFFIIILLFKFHNYHDLHRKGGYE